MRKILVKSSEVDAKDGAIPVHSYLKHYHHISTSLWKRIKFSGTFSVNGILRIAARTEVKAGDVISYDVGKKSSIPSESMRLDVRYEDDFLLAINKPAGLLVHPTHRTYLGTLAGGVLHHYAARDEQHDYHPIHRLDMDTSGLVLIAKEPEAQHILFLGGGKSFSREYLAIVEGKMVPARGTIDCPIARPDPQSVLRIVSPDGKPAVTHYERLAYDSRFSLLRLRLETGRTHQIRVHMQHLGFPLIGDRLYGGRTDPLPRQALHAARLTIYHPITGQRLSLSAPLPKDMTDLLVRFTN